MAVTRAQAKKLVGKKIYALKKDGSVVSGKLVGIRGNRLVLEQPRGKAQVKGLLPLVLFDLLAIGESPYGFGGPFYGGFGGPSAAALVRLAVPGAAGSGGDGRVIASRHPGKRAKRLPILSFRPIARRDGCIG